MDEPAEKRRPDIELGANVKAKELRFARRPESEVRFDGRPSIKSTSGSERVNLPDEVEPGITYRNVRVRWHAAARIVSRQGDERD